MGRHQREQKMLGFMKRQGYTEEALGVKKVYLSSFPPEYAGARGPPGEASSSRSGNALANAHGERRFEAPSQAPAEAAPSARAAPSPSEQNVGAGEGPSAAQGGVVGGGGRTDANGKRRPKLSYKYAAMTSIPVLEMACSQLGWEAAPESDVRCAVHWVASSTEDVTAVLSKFGGTSNFRVSRFPRMIDLCAKVPLAALLGQAGALHPEEVDRFWLPTICIPGGEADLAAALKDGTSYYIIKPSGGAQGDGIFLASSQESLQSQLRASEPALQCYVAQVGCIS
mmetsp:Transcript_45854/g.146326  ORF Transcript_45854/g.146326 Transcript_45854/m.146326 type:complete len:283 (-) Transcript_45854:1179-2027(-)